MQVYAALLQIPGMEVQELTITEWAEKIWADMGFMKWPLLVCLVAGILVIIWKFSDLLGKSARTKRILREVDELLTQQRFKEALSLTRDSNAPAANILYAGLELHDEGTDRVRKAIENQVLIELS